MKRLFFAFVVIFMFMALPMEVYGSSVRLVIDDSELFGLPAPPIIVSDSVLVPARAVFERMGGMVGWHSYHRQVTVYHGDDILIMTIDENVASLNGAPLQMPISPMIVNDSTMIPLRLPAEAFGFEVDWDSSERKAILNSNGNGTEPNNPGNTGFLGFEPPTAETPESATTNGSNLPVIPLPTDPNQPPVSDFPSNNFTGKQPDEHRHEEDYFPGGTALPPPGVVVAAPDGTNLARDVSTALILTINHPQTSITSLRTPRETGAAAYVIVASSPISSVTHFLLADNRLVVDIHNATSAINGDLYVDPSVPVSGVRASQFSDEPKVARVVFDLVGAAEYSISLSADRQLLTVAFSPNVITQILPQSDMISDSLIIRGDVLPSIRISTEGFPNFLTLNVENAGMDAQSGNFLNGVFASHFVAGQRPDGAAFIQVHMQGTWPSFSLSHSADAVALVLHPGITGMRYDSITQELRISREDGFTMDVSQVQHIDESLRYRYTLVLPPSAHVLGQGELSILDGHINSVTLERDVFGNTRLVFDLARILAFSLHETPYEYIVRVRRPRDVHPFIVVIDPGHGGSDPGTIHNSVVEKDMVLAVSHMVMQMVNANPNIHGYMTRVDDVNVLNQRRAEFANEIGADLFISIHANAAEIRRGVINPAIHGIETWYTIGELERMTGHSIDSRQVAEIMQRHKLQASGAHDRGLWVGNNLVVLRESNMPSALLELGFLTNPDEASRLRDTQYQWQLAQAIYNGIVEISLGHFRRT